MTGYGELTGDEARQMKSIAADLTASLERLAGYLDQGPDVDLHQRLEKLSHKQESVLPLLRELERIITAYGLVEFRGALTILLDRIQNETFEIGVFGRVSAGKSSFLNHLLGGKILPTGVTPVTSIPTRVRFGERPRATVEFAQGDPIMIDLEGDNVKPDRALLQQRLAEYTTEQQNPGNVKYVSRITVEVPAGRVPRGVTFVDTPGPGSLANNGADETAAYLPRCDLGLVLVDSGTSVVREDLLILQALFRSGAEVMMLISKADLLAPKNWRPPSLTLASNRSPSWGWRFAYSPSACEGKRACCSTSGLRSSCVPCWTPTGNRRPFPFTARSKACVRP
jgi:GTP-binding protein EngB required for normal cell division